MNAQELTQEQQDELAGRPPKTDNNRTTVIDITILNAESIFDSGGAVDLNLININDHQHQRNPNGASGPAITNFQSNIYNGEQVIWILKMDDSQYNEGYSGELTQIEIKSGSFCIFGKSKVPGNSPIIIATVEGDESCNEKDEGTPYTVKFLLRNAEGDVRTFEFDPIMFVNT